MEFLPVSAPAMENLQKSFVRVMEMAMFLRY